MRTGSVVLPRRVAAQPVPFLHPGGDCGPCVLGGLLGCDVQSIYASLGKDPAKDSFAGPEMYDALEKLLSAGAIDRLVTDIPWWVPWKSSSFFGAPAWEISLEWFQYVRMAIDAGYYGVAPVVHQKNGPLECPDHWVLIAGARVVEEEIIREGKRLGATLRTELLISNSSTTSPAVPEEWVRVGEFLKHWGGYNLFLVRPSPVIGP